MEPELVTIFVACEACQLEGRVLVQTSSIWDETDLGVCPECQRECVIEVEAHLVTLEDLQ